MKHDDPHTLDLFAPEDSALPLRDHLHAWQTQGLLRPLDIAWMQFVHTHHPSAPDCVLLASALLAHVESRGHSCLPLADRTASRSVELLKKKGVSLSPVAGVLHGYALDCAALITGS